MLPSDRDIDREARRNGPIDIGADETTECWRYYITLICDATHAPIGTPVKVTACVFDSVEMNQPEAGYELGVSVDAGQIVSVTRSGSPVTLPALTQSTYGITDANGNVDAYVTRNTQGFLNATCTITQCELPASRTAQVYFGQMVLVDLVFLIDVTGSTSGGALMRHGIKATVDYLYEQLQVQGRALRVAGIKFSDYYPVNPAVGNNRAELRDFAVLADTEARDAFKNWVDAAGPGGDVEYQLDILMFAKDMSPAALPGLYIALATDEDSDSTLDMQTVANALDQSNAIVFIDPKYAALVPYYQPLAVNGGAIEQESGNLGTFTFQRMRQAILGTP